MINEKLKDTGFTVTNLDLSTEMTMFMQERINEGYCIAWTFGLIADGYSKLFDRITEKKAHVIAEPNNATRFFFSIQEGKYYGLCDGQELQIYSKGCLWDIMEWAHEYLSDITIGYGNETRLEMHLFSLNGGKVSDKVVHISPDTFGTIYDFLYPDIDPKILYEQFMASEENILILYGLPGTGKTSFIKYLVSHQAAGTDKIAYAKDEKCIANAGLWNHLHGEKYKVMVLDDADSLLEPRKNGLNEALSQLLSFSDGLMKNKTKLIITTNQHVKEIDDALVRPGRCFDFIVLEPMKYEYAKNVWLNKLGNDEESFNIAFKGLTNITQASLMEQHNRIRLDMRFRNYMRSGPRQYSVQQKLAELDINCTGRQKAGFTISK